MRSLTRHTLRQLAIASAIVLVSLTCVMWLSQSLRYVDTIINRGLPVSVFLELTGLLAPALLAYVFPIALFVAVMFVYARMTMDRELVVLQAAGLSPMTLARPALLLALAGTALAYALHLYVVPASFRTFKDFEDAIRNNYATVLLQEGVFNSIPGDITIYVRERTRSGELIGILVHDGRDPARPATFMAERGTVLQGPDGPRVVMVNGSRQEVAPDTGRLSLLYFDRYAVDLAWLQAKQGARPREARERFLSELLFPSDARPGDRLYPRLVANGHATLLRPLSPLTLTLIGAALLLTGAHNRRGQGRRVAAASVAAVAVEAANFATLQLAIRDVLYLPLMYVAAWAPLLAALLTLLRASSGAPAVRPRASQVA